MAVCDRAVCHAMSCARPVRPMVSHTVHRASTTGRMTSVCISVTAPTTSAPTTVQRAMLVTRSVSSAVARHQPTVSSANITPSTQTSELVLRTATATNLLQLVDVDFILDHVVHFRTSVTLTPTLTLEVRKCTSPCRDYTSMQYENADYQTSLLCLVYTLAFSLLYVGFAATEIRRDIYT